MISPPPPPFAQISLPRCRRRPFSTSPIVARTKGPSQAASTRQRGRARADGTGSRGQQAAAPDPRSVRATTAPVLWGSGSTVSVLPGRGARCAGRSRAFSALAQRLFLLSDDSYSSNSFFCDPTLSPFVAIGLLSA